MVAVKKVFCDFFFFIAYFPPIRIAYLHTQECEGSVQYNYIIIIPRLKIQHKKSNSPGKVKTTK